MLVKRNTLAEKYFIELISVFKEQNWDIEESISGENSVFDMFCKRLEELESDADRELMLELTRKYLVVDLEEYGKYMVNVFRKFIDRNKDKLDKMEVIHMFPVQDKDYPAKTKSGNVMCYLFQGNLMRRFDEFRNKRIRIIETFDGLEKYKEDIECLLLVDDFVGTGDTILGCINLIEGKGIKKEKIKALTLVMQEQGRNAVEEYGVETYSAVLRNRAITDNYSIEEAEKKIVQMKNISKRIKAKKVLFGVFIIDTNPSDSLYPKYNTFPFYWYEGKRGGKLCVAPFARRNNVGVDV